MVRKKHLSKRTQKNKKTPKTVMYTIFLIAGLLVLDSIITFTSNLPFIAQVENITKVQIITFVGLGALQIFAAYWLIKFKLRGLYIALLLTVIALVYEIMYPLSYGWMLLYFLPKDIFIFFYLYRKRKIFH